MRIVSWNCCWQKNGFSDKKREEILKLNPDILLIQECKQEDWVKLNYSDKNGHWYGDGKESQGDPNKNIGIGIFCNKKYSIDCSLFKNQDLSKMRYALPYLIKTEDKEILTIFSVWAKKDFYYYHIPILNSLEFFHKKTCSPIIIVGDFNTGSKYNTRRVFRDHTEKYYEFIKNELKTKYLLENCASWQEWIPTFFRGNNSWLDDHCFASTDFQVISFGLGNFDYWRQYSDHCPIIVDFNF
jgi:endonuclease/exonuclease/phosphatase family metal-dependent hydrolase